MGAKFSVGQRVGVYAESAYTNAPEDANFPKTIPVTTVVSVEFEKKGTRLRDFVIPVDCYFYELEGDHFRRFHESFLFPIEDDGEFFAMAEEMGLSHEDFI